MSLKPHYPQKPTKTHQKHGRHQDAPHLRPQHAGTLRITPHHCSPLPSVPCSLRAPHSRTDIISAAEHRSGERAGTGRRGCRRCCCRRGCRPCSAAASGTAVAAEDLAGDGVGRAAAAARAGARAARRPRAARRRVDTAFLCGSPSRSWPPLHHKASPG